MATKKLQIGTTIYNIPLQGGEAGWGEDVTDFLEAVADSLSTVQNSGDILPTAVTLSNNISSASDIPGMKLDSSIVASFEIDYYIKRIYNSGSTTIMEQGEISGYYDGTDFFIAHERKGDDTGVVITVTSAGQFQYTSTNLANHTSSTMVFSAKTILEP